MNLAPESRPGNDGMPKDTNKEEKTSQDAANADRLTAPPQQTEGPGGRPG